MEAVTGIGGVFLRAKDPAALAAWYAANLGVAIENEGGTYSTLAASDGDQTVWATFSHDTDSFGRPEQQAMVNYRVRDLDAMLAQLRAAGVAVEERIEELEFGRFGWAVDPEGNRFELWQTAA
ncbi:MAG: VOC family protein [Actinobacteria bacterium]|nr:VOC family protein [Actinomycetota bacterium]